MPNILPLQDLLDPTALSLDPTLLDDAFIEADDEDLISANLGFDIDDFGSAPTQSTFDPFAPEHDQTLRALDSERQAGDGARAVEDTFLNLLETAQRQQILVLTGQAPVTSRIDESMQNFGQLYSKALAFNPALRWYPKLVSSLKETEFGVDAEGLFLDISDVRFSLLIGQFISDFPENLRDLSEIVNLVRNAYDAAQAASDAAIAARKGSGQEAKARREASDLDATALDFSIHGLEDGFDTVAELEGLDLRSLDQGQKPKPSLNLDVIPEKTDALQLNIRDFSNRALAEFLIIEDADPETAENLLREEGFDRTRMQHVLGIYNYLRAQSSVQSFQQRRSLLGDKASNFLLR